MSARSLYTVLPMPPDVVLGASIQIACQLIHMEQMLLVKLLFSSNFHVIAVFITFHVNVVI